MPRMALFIIVLVRITWLRQAGVFKKTVKKGSKSVRMEYYLGFVWLFYHLVAVP